jgi:hypothetical protein
VAGAGTTISAPVITANDGSVNVVELNSRCRARNPVLGMPNPEVLLLHT